MTLVEETIKVESILDSVCDAVDTLREILDDRRLFPDFENGINFALWALEELEEYLSGASSSLRSIP